MNAITESENQMFSERMKQALHEFDPETVLAIHQIWEASIPQRETLRPLTDDEPPLDSIDDRMHWTPNGADWDEEPYLYEMNYITDAAEVELLEAKENYQSILTELNARHVRERRAMDIPSVPTFKELDDQWAALVSEEDPEWIDPFKGVVDWGNEPLTPKAPAVEEKVVIDHYPKLKPPPEEPTKT